MSSMAEETRWLDATAQAALVHAGEATPAELVEAAIERIEAGNPALNAVVTETFDRARDAAASSALPDGPFRGVPFLVKDLWALTEGDRCTNGVIALARAGWRAPIDTTLVGRHRAAGLVILGRTNTPELGILPTTEPMAFGPTHNPWDLDRSPGGSSGGSAAAVAAGLVPAAHASDGGGSIRIPASCCGLVGLKVSQGRTTLGPLRDESGLGVEHVVTRSVRDAAALLDATCGPGVGDTVIAFEVAFRGEPGVICISGTGSVALGRNERGETTRAGGWGRLVSDEGSGHWIGRRAISQCLNAMDQGRSSRLITEIMEHWGIVTREQLVSRCHAEPVPNFSELFPVVQRVSDEGDPMAAEILNNAALKLARITQIVLRRLWSGRSVQRVEITGSVFVNSERIRHAYANLIRNDRPEVQIRLSERQPVEGALQLASENIGEKGQAAS
jgi:N-acetylglucosamine kinase-like BadF-type ATPase